MYPEECFCMRSKKVEHFDLDEFNKDKPNKSIKRTTKFTVLLIPDSTDHSRSFELTFDHILRIGAIALAICIVLVSLLISSGIKNYKLSHDLTDKKKIEELNEQIDRLNDEKKDMYDRIVNLTDLLAEKQETEEILNAELAAQSLPIGNPIEGMALMVDESSDEEHRPVEGRVLFNTIIGTAIVACADGVVSEVSEDPEFGNVVTIDHGNGYQSIYRCKGSIRVVVGSTVAKHEVIYVITEEDSLFAYEILKNGVAIEPLDIMEIKG